MTKQRLELSGSERARHAVDRKALDKLFRGEIDFVEALGLDDDSIKKMRLHALALFESGKWNECIDVVVGIVALGRIQPSDALFLAKCYLELGQSDVAEQCLAQYEQMVEAVGKQ